MKIKTYSAETIEVGPAAMQPRSHIAIRVREDGYWYKGEAIIYLNPLQALTVALELISLAFKIWKKGK